VFRVFALSNSSLALPGQSAANPDKCGFEDRAMTELVTQDHASKPKRNKVRMVADDVVTANSLATHLGMTRQNVARLMAEAVIEQRSDGCYDQTASRLKYIKHLRDEHRRSPRPAADAKHAEAETALLQIRIEEKQRTLMRRDAHEAIIDEMAGLVLTKLGGWPARVGGADLGVRQRAEAALRELRTEIAEAATKLAAKCGEPPLDDDTA
jgi:hypothetical protein